MSAPRGLSAEEQAAWARLAQSVTPMAGKAVPKPVSPGPGKATVPIPVPPPKPPVKSPRRVPSAQPARTPMPPPRRSFHSELDGHWNRKLKAGQIAPDYTLDLHDHTLDAAYDRIISGIDQARGLGARVVLVVAGRDRGADPADRQHHRGAIRAKLLDWLAASHHGDAIAAVRKAHQRHGGEGALYLVLKRAR